MSELISRQKLIEELKKEVMDFPHPHAGMNRPYWWNKAINKSINVVESQPPADNWIPCSERLPEAGQKVLVTLGSTIGKQFVRTDQIIDGDWWQWNGNYVIAWMPLPEPYKGVE